MTIKKDGNYFKITSNIGAPVSKIDEGEELITKVVAGKSFPDPLPNVSPISSSPSPPPLVLPPLKTDKTSFPNSSNEMQSNPIALPSPLSSESSTPYGKKTSWKDKISNYLTTCSEDAYIRRATTLALTGADIEMFLSTLNESAEEGVPLALFVSTWRLLSEDVEKLKTRYPEIDRGLMLARSLRKMMPWDALSARVHTNPTAALKLLEQNKMLDSDLDKEDMSGLTVEQRAEKLLLDSGIEPCEYDQILYLRGDLEFEDAPLNSKELEYIGHTPEQIIKLLEKK